MALSFLATQALNNGTIEKGLDIIVHHGHWILLSLFLLFLAQFHHFLKIFIFQKPNTYIYARGPGPVGQWITGVIDHVIASGHVRKAYAEALGSPFSIPGVGKYKTFVTNSKQISEVENAPTTQLSFNHVVEELLSTDIIFGSFKFDPKDPRHTIPIHSLQILFKKQIPYVIPLLKSEMSLAFEKELGEAEIGFEWVKTQPHIFCRRMFEKLTNVVMVGKELADDPVFIKASLRFSNDALVVAEVLRFTPFFLREIVGRGIMWWSGAQKLVSDRLMAVLCERIEKTPEGIEKPLDMMQWMLDSTRKKTPQMVERLSHHTMAFLFAGGTAPPMLLCFALMKLCKYPEYLEPLREEIDRLQNCPETEEKYESMVFMDSFLKETARLQPILSFTVARRTLTPFTFADGTYVPKDNWICVPQQAMNLDEANYSSPYTFDPFRFVPRTTASLEEVQAAKFTTPSHKFLFWSGPKRPCTGRFFVTITTKMILAEFIKSYDFKLETPNLPESFPWNHVLIPHPQTRILFRKKAELGAKEY